MTIQTINTVTGEVLSERRNHKHARRKSVPRRGHTHKPSGTTQEATHELLFVLLASMAIVGYALTR